MRFIIKKYFLLCILLLALVSGHAYASKRSKTALSASPETVVLVHGFMRSKMNMAALSYGLKKEGYQVINWSYPSKKKRVEEHGEDLVKRLQILAKESPNKPISFVTHSMGGLVVRCALNHPQCPRAAKTGRAVLIAPPNKGSLFARSLYKHRIARWVLGDKAGKQLMLTPFDGFDKLGNFPPDMPVLVIAGTMGWNPKLGSNSDGKVALDETLLKTPHYRASVPAGHSWICYSPKVIKQVKAFFSNKALGVNEHGAAEPTPHSF